MYIDGKKATIGSCEQLYVNANNSEPFCFVKEKSICSKLPFPGLPGQFISSEPCSNLRSPFAIGLLSLFFG